jgi:putative membrane protein
MSIYKLLACTLVLGAAGGLGACTTDDAADDATATLDSADVSVPEPTPNPTGQPALDDAQIAHVVLTANTADSAGGELAASRGTSEQVKAFARRMVQDHGSANQQATQLAQRLGVTPADNAASGELKTDADQHAQQLQGMSGAEFDRAYIEHEVQMHQRVLDALDQQLIPNARNPELRQLLETVRPTIQSHLEQARQIQSALGGQQ